jgi:hypothetical protein
MLSHFCEAQTDLSALPTAADVYPQQPHHQANSVGTIADMVAQRLLDAMATTIEEPSAAPTAPAALEQINALTQRESAIQACESASHTQMQEMMALFFEQQQRQSQLSHPWPRSRSQSHQR